jgi:hypothetical protein
MQVFNQSYGVFEQKCQQLETPYLEPIGFSYETLDSGINLSFSEFSPTFMG